MSEAKRALVAALAGVAIWGGAVASAEITQRDGVRVLVTGEMTPTKLPRDAAAPVAVSVAGRIIPTEPGRLPQLTKVAIALNSHGNVETGGIPTCRIGQISPSTTAGALEACGPALVGEGHFSADVKLPEQSPFPSAGKLLAFNGRINGKPAILAHVYGSRPLPTSYVMPFEIRSQGGGTYGTVLESSLPNATGEWGYVTGLSLAFRRSYLSATCPAPKGFHKVGFPLLRATFGFKGGLSLAATLNRSCSVR